MYLVQWSSKAAEGVDHHGWQSRGGDKIGVITAKMRVIIKGASRTCWGGKIAVRPGRQQPTLRR